MSILDPAVADQLRLRGDIDDATYDAMVNPLGSQGFTGPMPLDPMADAQPLPPPDPDEARRQRQRDMFAEHKQGVADMEVAKQERVQEAIQKERDDLAASIERKRMRAAAMGVPENITEEMLADDIAQLASYDMPQPQTAEAQAEPEGSVQLASDRMADPTARVPDPNAFQAPQVGTPGLDMQQAGVMMGAKVAEDAGRQQAHMLKGFQEAREDQQAADYMQELRRQDEAEQKAQELEASIEEVGAMKVDTGRFFKNQSTGAKIASIIGVMLSGYASGLTGRGGNPALQMLQNAVREDIAAQKADIANARDGVTAQRGVYREMLGRHKDERLAESAAEAAAYKNVELQIKELAARTQSQQAKANLMTQLGEIQARKEAAQADAMKRYQAMQAVGTGNVEMMTDEQRARYVPGYGLALTKEDAKRVKEKSATIDTARDGLNDLLAMTKETGKSLSFSERAKAKTIANMLIGNLRTEIVGPGAMNEREVELMNDIIANPTRITSLDSTNRAALQTVLKRLDSSMENELRSAGIISPKAQVGFTPKQEN